MNKQIGELTVNEWLKVALGAVVVTPMIWGAAFVLLAI